MLTTFDHLCLKQDRQLEFVIMCCCLCRSSGPSLGGVQWGGDDPATDPGSVRCKLNVRLSCVSARFLLIFDLLLVLKLTAVSLAAGPRTRGTSCGTLQLVFSSTSTWSRCIHWLQSCWRKTSSSIACALTWSLNSKIFFAGWEMIGFSSFRRRSEHIHHEISLTAHLSTKKTKESFKQVQDKAVDNETIYRKCQICY